MTGVAAGRKEFMNRRTILVAAVAMVAATAVAACGSSSSSSGSGSGSASGSAGSSTTAASSIPAGPITIGAPLALTGALNFADGPQLQGIQLAISNINAKGGVLGHKFKLITADTKSNPPTIATAAQTVINAGAQFMIPTMDYNSAVRRPGLRMRTRSSP